MFRKSFSILKYPLLFASGGVAHHFYEDSRHTQKYPEMKTKIFQKQIFEEDKLQHPKLYNTYMKVNKFDQFFEKLIIKDNNGLQYFDLFVSEELMDVAHYEKKTKDVKDFDNLKLTCVFSANPQVQGHFNIVHGGFTATIIDNLFGYLATLTQGLIPCATGDLDIRYKKPLICGREYMIECTVDDIQGRKVGVNATIKDKNGRVCCEAKATMIRVKWDLKAWQFLFDNLRALDTVQAKIQKKLLHYTQDPRALLINRYEHF